MYVYLDVPCHVIWSFQHVGEHLTVPLHRYNLWRAQQDRSTQQHNTRGGDLADIGGENGGNATRYSAQNGTVLNSTDVV